jgi:hypothetical protein
MDAALPPLTASTLYLVATPIGNLEKKFRMLWRLNIIEQAGNFLTKVYCNQFGSLASMNGNLPTIYE